MKASPPRTGAPRRPGWRRSAQAPRPGPDRPCPGPAGRRRTDHRRPRRRGRPPDRPAQRAAPARSARHRPRRNHLGRPAHPPAPRAPARCRAASLARHTGPGTRARRTHRIRTRGRSLADRRYPVPGGHRGAATRGHFPAHPGPAHRRIPRRARTRRRRTPRPGPVGPRPRTHGDGGRQVPGNTGTARPAGHPATRSARLRPGA